MKRCGLLSYKLTHVLLTENGLKFNLDLENSQKKPAFLDQAITLPSGQFAEASAAKLRRVLDCFCRVARWP